MSHTSSAPSASPKRYAWLIFILMCLAYFLIPFHRVSPAVMATDIMAGLGLDAPAMGLLASTFFVAYGIMQIPSGLLTDGVGPRRLLPLMVGLSGFGAAMFGVSDSLLTAAVGRAIMGIGVSVIFLCGMKLIGEWFPVSVFARMSSLFLGMGGVGMFLAAEPLALGCSIWGWRTMFYACGVGSIGLAVLLFVFIRDTPKAKATPRTKAVDWALMWHNMRLVTRHRDFWCACVWIFCHFNMHMSFGGLWGGTYLRDVHGLSQVEAGAILNVAGIGVIVGGVLVGWLCDVVFRSRRMTMLFASVVLTVNFFVLMLFGDRFPLWTMYVWFFVLSTLGVPAVSAAFSAMRYLFGVEATGSACGLLNCLPSVGVLLFQPLTGIILTQYDVLPNGSFPTNAYSAACWLYIVAGVIGFVGAWCMHEEKTPL